MSRLRQINHQIFLSLIDKLEEEGILVPCTQGYRLSVNIFNELRKNPSDAKERIRDLYIDYTVEPTEIVKKSNKKTTTPNRIDDIRNRIEYENSKELNKHGLEKKISSLRPKLNSNNLAVDIVTVMAYNLMGDRFKKGTQLPSWISLGDIMKNLQEAWVFID